MALIGQRENHDVGFLQLRSTNIQRSGRRHSHLYIELGMRPAVLRSTTCPKYCDRIGARLQPHERPLLADQRLAPLHPNLKMKVPDRTHPLANIRKRSIVGFRIDGKCQRMQFTSSH